jgi:3-oxo-5-alpha-steroid 4-dehydrogenase 3 / polyprenol reductase
MQTGPLLVAALRAYFLLTSVGVLIVRVISPLHKAFIPYGKTLNGRRKSESTLQWLANFTVPKSWFWHYYFMSVVLSSLWGTQFVLCCFGSSLCIVESLARVNGRTIMVWGMLFLQGCRRLYESLCMQRPSSARMWIGHYIAGNGFYIMMNMAVLVEGSSRPHGSIRFLNSDSRGITTPFSRP